MRNYWTRVCIPHRLDAETVTRLRACQSDACHQGRRSCPTPQACALPEGDITPAGSARGLVLALIALAVALASVVIHFWPQIVAAFEEIL